MQEVTRKSQPQLARAKQTVERRGVVEPGAAAAAAGLPQLLAIACVGAAVLYFSLSGGWRAGSIFGLALVVLPLLEAIQPGFLGTFMNGLEQVQRLVHTLGAVVIVLAIAVLGWIALTQPKRLPPASAPRIDEMVRKQAAQGSARRRVDDEEKPRFYKQGRPMASEGPGTELYVRRLRPD